MHPQQLLGHLQYLTARGDIPVATLMRSHCYASQACLHCLNDGSQCTDNNRLGNGYRGKNFPEEVSFYVFFDFITMSIV